MRWPVSKRVQHNRSHERATCTGARRRLPWLHGLQASRTTLAVCACACCIGTVFVLDKDHGPLAARMEDEPPDLKASGKLQQFRAAARARVAAKSAKCNKDSCGVEKAATRISRLSRRSVLLASPTCRSSKAAGIESIYEGDEGRGAEGTQLGQPALSALNVESAAAFNVESVATAVPRREPRIVLLSPPEEAAPSAVEAEATPKRRCPEIADQGASSVRDPHNRSHLAFTQGSCQQTSHRFSIAASQKLMQQVSDLEDLSRDEREQERRGELRAADNFDDLDRAPERPTRRRLRRINAAAKHPMTHLSRSSPLRHKTP